MGNEDGIVAAGSLPAAHKLELCRQNLSEIEGVLQAPLAAADRAERVCAFAYAITVHAPNGAAAELARKIRKEVRTMSARHLDEHVRRLRLELEAVGKNFAGERQER